MTPTDSCPDEQDLAAFVDGALTLERRATVSTHVDGCATCFTTVAAIGRMADAPAPVPTRSLLDRVEPPRRFWTTMRVSAASAAAVVVLVVGLWEVRRSSFSTSPTPPAAAAAGHSGVRGARPAADVRVLAPNDGGELLPGAEIRWTGIEHVTFYEIQVTTSTGDLLWRGEAPGAAAGARVPFSFPPGTSGILAEGSGYLWVTAHLPQGRRVSSPVVRIRLPAGP